MRSHLFLLFAALAIPTPSVAQAGPLAGTEAVKPIFDKADLVCSGRIKSVSIVHRTTGGPDSSEGGLVRVTTTILDVYKSGLTPSSPLVLEYPTNPMSEEPGIRPGEVVLLFLSRLTSGAFELADPFIGFTTFSGISQVPGNLGLEKLQFALAVNIRQGDRDDQINAMRLLEGFDRLDPNTLSTVSALSSSTDPAVAFAALAVLLKTRTPDSVAKFLGYLQGYKEDQPPIGLISAAAELSLITDGRALPDIEGLSNSRFISVQMAAMDAIRRIASGKSAPTLMRRLDDPNRNVRYLAVITLAELFGKSGDYGPSAELFDKKPAYYGALWKKWWEEEGSKLYPPDPTKNKPGGRQIDE
jgi:hypothetical protein